MRILFAVTRELSYPRNDVILRGMQRFAEVTVLGESTRPRSLLMRSLAVAIRLIPQVILRRYDLIFLGFWGQIPVLPVGLFGHAPLLFDAFVSTYDTLITDRETFSAHSPGGRLAYWLDRAACRLADHILLDTRQHVEYFNHTFGVPLEKFSALPVGCNEDLFSPRPVNSLSSSTRVLYYTTYMPLHGVETVIQAASLLKDQAIHFRLIGDGPTHNHVREVARQLGLINIEFIPYLPLKQLPAEIAAADICLGGHFGTSDKAGRVVPGKVYQVLAMSRPLIATATPANLDLLVHGESAYICPPDDASSLAAAVLELSADTNLRQRLASGGRARYLERCSETVITDVLKGVINQMVIEKG